MNLKIELLFCDRPVLNPLLVQGFNKSANKKEEKMKYACKMDSELWNCAWLE